MPYASGPEGGRDRRQRQTKIPAKPGRLRKNSELTRPRETGAASYSLSYQDMRPMTALVRLCPELPTTAKQVVASIDNCRKGVAAQATE